MAPCPAAARRRGRHVTFAEDAIVEGMPPQRRARTQPADEMADEPSVSPTRAAPSADAVGANSTTPPPPDRHRRLGPARAAYASDGLCGCLAAPQVLKTIRPPTARSRRSPRSRS